MRPALAPAELGYEGPCLGSSRRECFKARAIATGKSCDDRQDSIEAVLIGQVHEDSTGADGKQVVHITDVEIIAKIKRGDANTPLAEGFYC